MACLFLAAAVPQALAVPAARPYTVDHYDVRITPDLGKQHLTGEVAIEFHATTDRLEAIELDAATTLEVTAVLDGGVSQKFKHEGGQVLVALSKAALKGERRTLTVRYQAGPGKGLKFFPDQVYSAYSTDEWLVCNFRPDGRATLRLWITAVDGLQVAASGEGSSPWHIDTPTPPFLYGFAVGHFTEWTSPGLRILGPPGDAAPWRAILAITREAIQFFAEKTGKEYSGALYTQVFTHGRPEQENANLTLLPESYRESLQKLPDDLWLLAHELAHQWFAVQIQCRDWSDFWLNEGMATFLADAFLEHRFGRQRYEKEIEESRTLYEGFKSQGKDRSLSFHNWTTTQEANGRIPYHKGAYVLDLLRRQMGDEAFWRGFRLYTRQSWTRSVTSEDFQNAMQAASGKSLAPFFEQWVYSPR